MKKKKGKKEEYHSIFLPCKHCKKKKASKAKLITNERIKHK